MSSIIDPQPDPSASDELVAYLDGELPPQDCRRVESRLATDEEYRQELQELDRAWEALDSLPATSVDDGFARTTIELACVAAEADLTQHTAAAKMVRRHRARRWIAGGAAAAVVGFLAGSAWIPNHNKKLIDELPAIQQVNVLPYVENVEFLRRLGQLVPPEQLVKDSTAFDRNVKELENANSHLLEQRRDWVQAMSPEQKAELNDRARLFDDYEPSSDEQQRMRRVMEDIRKDPDVATLQKTLVAYGQWLSRHTAAQHQQLQESLARLPADKQAELVQKQIEREGELAYSHLSDEDADALRKEILQIAKEKKPEFLERLRQGRKTGRWLNAEEPVARQSTAVLVAELAAKREETTRRLIEKLSPAKQAYWESLGRNQREFGRPWQLWVWIQDAMNLKVDPKELQRFFASDKLTDEKRQELLDMPRARMDTQLERMYFRSELGIDNPGQFFGEFGEPGRLPRNGLGRPDGPMRNEPGGPGGPRPRQGFRPGRPPGPDGGPDRGPDRRPDDRPGDRPPLNRPRQPGPNQPPPPDQKQEAI